MRGLSLPDSSVPRSIPVPMGRHSCIAVFTPFPKGQDCRSFMHFSSMRLLHKYMPLQCLAKCLALMALNKYLVKMNLRGRKPHHPQGLKTASTHLPQHSAHPCSHGQERPTAYHSSQSYKESTLLNIQGQFLFLPLPVTLAGVRTGAVAWYRVEEILLM